jgi:hypothetical protein
MNTLMISTAISTSSSVVPPGTLVSYKLTGRAYSFFHFGKVQGVWGLRPHTPFLVLDQPEKGCIR